jgi:hypothetical protein
MYMLKFTEWMELKEQMIGTAAAGASGIVKKMPGMSGFDKTKKRIDSTIKGLFLKGNTKQATKQVDTIINGEINNASTGLEDAAKLAGMRDSIKKSLSSL